MHVPWGWIKQRPHFIAEELLNDFNVDVYIPKFYKTPKLIKNCSSISITTLFQFPLARLKIVKYINTKIAQYILKYQYRIHEYHYIWITDLRLYPYIKDILTNKQKLIYDCMDDVLAFEVLKSQYEYLQDIEQKLFEQVDLVFFSSEKLQEKKVNKYHLKPEKYSLIYNALDKIFIDSNIYDKYDSFFDSYRSKNYTVLTYIGTISNWFDFEAIEKSLENISDIVYFMIGPVEKGVEVLHHERIKYLGPIEHQYIKSIMLKSDILIMPFKVNELIESVDPVKMYEYIALGKQIISVKYDELNKFSRYIDFYENHDEFIHVIQKCEKSQKENIINEDFINKNSWETRESEVVKRIWQLSST